MSESREAEFDFDQFLFRCTEEFMKLQAAETRVIISGNDINYAPSLPLDSEWQEAGESVFRQVRFSAAFLYRQEVGYGVLDFDRPVAVIKFGHELYWRTVPKRHAQECIAEAKQRKVYVDINVQPVRQPIDGKSKEVMAFVNRCYEHVLQNDYPHFPVIETTYKGVALNLSFNENCKQQYRFTINHLKAGKTLDKIFEIAHWLTSNQRFDFGFSGVENLLTLHLRCDNTVSLFQCPETLVAEAHDWAEKNQKLIASPYAIVSEKVSAIGSK